MEESWRSAGLNLIGRLLSCDLVTYLREVIESRIPEVSKDPAVKTDHNTSSNETIQDKKSLLTMYDHSVFITKWYVI